MTPKIAIISDIHGCYYTLLRLIKKLPKGIQIIFAGDLIDRGPNSKEVVQYAIDHGIPTVIGNHEHMMVDHVKKEGGYDEGVWLHNGGTDTLKSYGGKIPDHIVGWVSHLPLEIRHGRLHVSHTGVGKHCNPYHALWSRGLEQHLREEKSDIFRVFGHTPANFVLLADNFARIDTGAAYRSQGYGTLSAFIWPTRQVVSQEYDETPIEEVKKAG